MGRLFLGGVPTHGDVKRLLGAFPDIQPDVLIPYERLAEVLQIEHGTSRFNTVVNAWRKLLLRTQNIAIVAVSGKGLRRLSETERSVVDRAGWRRDQAKAARKVRDLGRVDTRDFDERELKTHEHARRVLQAHVEHTASTVREIAPPAPQAQLPKRGPTG